MHFCVADWKLIGLKDDKYVDPLSGITYDAFCDGSKILKTGLVLAFVSSYVTLY